ncbi:MAG: Bax inhibitor-1/YccA family protein [Flavobacteriales bacterium]|nr:Bax inhibitor-1/YccA family protein [Flavobacteriales bacterium]
MDNLEERGYQGPIITSAEATGTDLQAFMTNVFSWMTGALMITAFTAYGFASQESLFSLLYTPTGGHSVLGWVAMLAPLGIVIAMGAALQRLSYMSLMLLFIGFSVIMGISMSYIFYTYAASTIYQTFFITAATFGTMAVLGYTTKTDLTKFGRLLFMGLIGIILAMVVNWFLGSSQLDYIISIIGVLVFTGLTAYDVQRLKRIGLSIPGGTEIAGKAAIMGALSLYLDFINLFLMLLRLFGGRD